ncbi:MAG: NIPSNAP family protein [Verrucomicrobia bacterium]|nr:NIPSNAP family protein [Verrucomicrobiota bacterium]
MNRRTFLTSAAVAGSASLLSAAAHKAGEQRFHELIRFEVLNNSKRGQLEKFLGDTVIPGLNKLGCSPIGVFRPKYGARGSEVYMLVPHANIESFLTVWDKLEATEAYQAAADREMEDPLYQRMESSLMKAFSGMPKVEIPSAIEGHRGRIFELRRYESHNRLKGTRKIEMFNEGGEIQIFRDVGLHPVFFGQTVAGPLMPNLVYMLAFKDMEQRDKHWKQFSSSPAWAELKKETKYNGTVSTITDVILSASGVSQI